MFEQLSHLSAACALVAFVATSAHAGNNENAIKRLKEDAPGGQVSVKSATETATFVRIPPGQAKKAASSAANDLDNAATAYVNKHAAAFGLRAASRDLTYRATQKDSLGQSHVKYSQEYGDVPVFGAFLSAHFDAANRLVAVNGTLIPDINLSTAPSHTADEAAAVALQLVGSSTLAANLGVRNSRLVIFREGLLKGVPGPNHLAYEVEVGNGVDVREFVFVDAHTGKFIDQLTGINEDLNRRAYDGLFLPGVPPSYPGAPYWVEGDGFPTASAEANNMIVASEETHSLFANAFGRDSFDGAGAVMDSIFNRGYNCPNASWNGVFISFCSGLTTDDVTGHEWAHAYTQYTDGLIYAWQSGALNESYSDVVGETVDRINGRDVLLPNDARSTDGSCSAIQGTEPPTLTITGGSAAGSYFATASVNEPPAPFTIGPLPMSVTEPADACGAITNDVSGQIAIIDWEIAGAPSGCGSGTRAANAIAAGAAGIIFVAPEAGLLNLGSNAAIGSVQVTYDDGATIKAGLPAQATMEFTLGADDSVLWLVGEDSTATGLAGALRDMYLPSCFGDPDKVSDPLYACDKSYTDNGGVHSNSGVPNHAFALLVDGGNFNGQSINAIGLTKASHIEFRAKTYQGPVTDFTGHADALEQSCTDLLGVDLASLADGTPSGEIITTADCGEVSKAIAAVEMRSEPTQCGFQPLLAQNPPPLCDAPTKSRKVLFTDRFENGDSSLDRWSVSHGGTTADFTERDWTLVSNLPDGRNGRAFFGPDPNYGTCAPGGDESAVLHLDSPQITIPAAADNLRMAFDHWIATESGWDGGNVKISVNGGDWTVVAPEDFVYNPYNVHTLTGWNFLVPDFFGNTNPMAGEYAWSGTDEGSLSGSWGRSIINLAPYAGPKDKIRLRFDIGNDGCGGAIGWYVDDVSVYQCR